MNLEAVIDKINSSELTDSEFFSFRDTPEYRKALARIHRADLLPIFFKFRGQEYSLRDYPQFREMYSNTYVEKSIWITGRQIGKTLNLAQSEAMDLVQIPHFQILYVAPLKPQAMRYSALYLTPAFNSCNFIREIYENPDEMDDDAGPILRNLSHKTLPMPYGSGIQLTYAKSDSDRARGIYADRIDFDEIQDQLFDNLPIITQSLTNSPFGVSRFTGTAKTVDNTIEQLWQTSSMNEYVIKCGHCPHWNIPNMEGKVLDMIQVKGPSCVKCGGLLDVRAGQFVPTFPDRIKSFVGWHIPQIIIPAIAEDPVKWSRLVNKVLGTSSIATIYQEILGISSSVGARAITQQDIDEASTLPSVGELQKRIDDYVITVAGVDWGVAEESSFSVLTVIGVRSDGRIHVLWAKRYIGFDPDTMLQDIARTSILYKCSLVCCDYGMGFDKNVMLVTRFSLPVVQINYTSQKQFLALRPTLGYARWMVDKVSALDNLFWSIKYKNIQFPPKEEMDKYTRDLLSPYEHVTDVSGFETRRYMRNPNMPDDFCNALCFAVLGAMKLMGKSISDAVPEDKMSGRSMPGEELVRDNIDPRSLLSL